jgi:hypothetical protein
MNLNFDNTKKQKMVLIKLAALALFEAAILAWGWDDWRGWVGYLLAAVFLGLDIFLYYKYYSKL